MIDREMLDAIGQIMDQRLGQQKQDILAEMGQQKQDIFGEMGQQKQDIFGEMGQQKQDILAEMGQQRQDILAEMDQRLGQQKQDILAEMDQRLARQKQDILGEMDQKLDRQKHDLREEMTQQKKEIIQETTNNMMVLIESEITPKFNLLADGQKDILEKLVPRSRVDDLEEEVRFLKSLYRQMNGEIEALKKAQ